MATPDFDELAGRIRGLLISLGGTVAFEDSAEVDELLDHAELGEALRALAWLIVEDGKRVAMADVLEIEALAARMDMSQELPQTLRRHGVGDA